MRSHLTLVEPDVRQSVYLRCSCGWVSESVFRPSLALLDLIERRHLTGGSTSETIKPAVGNSPYIPPCPPGRHVCLWRRTNEQAIAAGISGPFPCELLTSTPSPTSERTK